MHISLLKTKRTFHWIEDFIFSRIQVEIMDLILTNMQILASQYIN